MWVTARPAISAAFLALAVEVVEAFTIVLAVGTFSGWRPALLGSGAGLAVLTCLILGLGPLLGHIPIYTFQFVVGVLLLLFGMRWLRKAVLRAAGIIPLHDELAAFAAEAAHLQSEALSLKSNLRWIAGITAFKAVVLEGIEVAFVVIAVGAGRGHLWAASLGALAACAVVLAVGLLIHKPLSRVPENTLKLWVGVMLSAFGASWTGEGLGISWPGVDMAIVVFGAIFLATGVSLAAMLPRPIGEIAR